MFNRIGIRARIAGGSLIIAILISVVAGIVINSQVERIVLEGTITTLESDSEPYVIALGENPAEPFDEPGPRRLVAVVSPDGSTPLNTMPDALKEVLPTVALSDGTRNIKAGGKQYLVRTRPVDVAGTTWYVVAARNGEKENTVLSQMRLLLIAALAVISLGVAVAAWFLTAASLRPVKRLRTIAETLSTTSTDEVLPVGVVDDEINQLARTLNELIGRLRASAAHERQLVSDASHELRTPLAILRTQLELAQIDGATVEQLLGDIRGAERSAVRLSQLVTSLLELSTIEAADSSGRDSLSQLDREAVESIDRARFRASGSEVEIRYDFRPLRAPEDAASEVQYGIRAEDLGRIIDNLVNNSLAAMGDDATGTLDVRLSEASAGLKLSVSDTAGGLDPGFEARALQRFARPDEARAAGRGARHGAGLGLAIVAAIVKNANGTITLNNRPGVGLEVEIAVPLADAAVAAEA